MRKALWGIVLLAPLGVLPIACGGAVFTSDDGGASGSSSGGSSGSSSGDASGSSSGGSSGSSSGGSSGSSGSSSGGGGSGSGSSSGISDGGCKSGCVDSGAPCPANVPTSGSACSQDTLECEYGSSPVQSCDTVAVCSQSRWQIQAASGSNCQPFSGPPCAATFASVPRGAHCSPYGQVCEYLLGRCACTVSAGPVPLDASAAARWVCQDPQASGCPTPRAPLGSACTQQGLFCDYGACSIPGGTSESCQGGLWKSALTACPAAAAGP